jgi:hypothetical protein
MSWSAVVPSDSEESLAQAVEAMMNAHQGLTLGRIIAVSRKIFEPPKGMEGLRLVLDPEERFSFARRANLGIAAAGEDDVVLVGDDVEVQTSKAFDLMAEEAPLRIVAASVRGRVGPWWQREGENHAEVPFVSFICVYLPRLVLDLVGPLETGFPGYGYEDTDYCIRARRKGLSIGVCGRAVVEHTVRIRSAFIENHGRELSAMQNEAKIAFENKYRSERTT